MNDICEELWWRAQSREDLIFQCMNNNLWDNNPGEIDRWADDGGRVNDERELVAITAKKTAA